MSNLNNECQAYQAGYNLGWFRALQTINEELKEIADAMMNSSVYQQIVDEHKAKGQDPPIHFSQIMGKMWNLKEMENEFAPQVMANKAMLDRLRPELAKIEEKEKLTKLKGKI